MTEPRGAFHGLAIELKKDSGGRVSPSQKEWQQALKMRGYHATIAKGFDEAVTILTEYLTMVANGDIEVVLVNRSASK